VEPRAQLVGTILDKAYAEKRDTEARVVEISRHCLESPGQWPPTLSKESKKVGAEKNKLVPTDLGRSVLTFLLQHFTDLFEYDVTSHMEKRLDRIGEGVELWKDVLHDTWNSYKERYETLTSGAAQKSEERPNASQHARGDNLRQTAPCKF
jgi:DNA topoisomerase-1